MSFRNQAIRFSLHLARAVVGRRLLYRTSRFLGRGAREDVLNEPATNGELMVQTYALTFAQSNPIVFDVGANLGNWTASLLERSNGKQVTVHAFEPCRETHEILRRRVSASGWKHVYPIQKACSRTTGSGSMNVYGVGSGTNTLADLVEPADVSFETVALTSIDDYCDTADIGYIDLLKIDAEGCDFEVIAGACKMLSSHSVRLLQFEYNHRWIGARNYLRDVFLMLSPMGYRVGKLVGDGIEFYPRWHWELETYREGNYLACTEEIASKFPQTRPVWLFTKSGAAKTP